MLFTFQRSVTHWPRATVVLSAVNEMLGPDTVTLICREWLAPARSTAFSVYVVVPPGQTSRSPEPGSWVLSMPAPSRKAARTLTRFHRRWTHCPGATVPLSTVNAIVG